MCRIIYYSKRNTTERHELVVPGVSCVEAVLCMRQENAHGFMTRRSTRNLTVWTYGCANVCEEFFLNWQMIIIGIKLMPRQEGSKNATGGPKASWTTWLSSNELFMKWTSQWEEYRVLIYKNEKCDEKLQHLINSSSKRQQKYQTDLVSKVITTYTI